MMLPAGHSAGPMAIIFMTHPAARWAERAVTIVMMHLAAQSAELTALTGDQPSSSFISSFAISNRKQKKYQQHFLITYNSFH